MKPIEYEYTIPLCLVAYLEYGDASGLTDDEIKAADDLIAGLPRNYDNSVGCFDWPDDGIFTQYHDVEGIKAADCYEATYTIFEI